MVLQEEDVASIGLALVLLPGEAVQDMRLRTLLEAAGPVGDNPDRLLDLMESRPK